jgi:tRNA-Thr(GGU) m(6)t(6)A37 methyltransferase TsaA
MAITLEPVGIIHSCFKEKFGIPRQPGLAPAAKAQLELLPPYNDKDAVAGLEQVSHIWLQFWFHQNRTEGWRPKVRPPRLGGNKQMGVFATRSPVRPNPIGLSVVKLESIETANGKVILHLAGIDLVDGTPVIDIKPYVPYVDRVEEAVNEFADQCPSLLPVSFTEATQAFCENYQQADLKTLLIQVLQQDPRPQYQSPDPKRRYAMRLLDLDVAWYCQPLVEQEGWQIVVSEIGATSNS